MKLFKVFAYLYFLYRKIYQISYTPAALRT